MTEDEIRRIKETYVYEEGESEYGNAAWWEWADEKGLEAIEQGEVTEITTKEQFDEVFRSLRE